PSKNRGSSGRVSRQLIGNSDCRLPRADQPSRAPGSQAIPQFVLQLLARVVQPTHDRALRALHDPADVVVRKTFDFAKKYDRFVIGGQLVDRLLHALADLARLGLLVRIAQALIRQSRFDVLATTRPVRQRHRSVSLVAAAKIDAQIYDDAVEPCVEARL